MAQHRVRSLPQSDTPLVPCWRTLFLKVLSTTGSTGCRRLSDATRSSPDARRCQCPSPLRCPCRTCAECQHGPKPSLHTCTVSKTGEVNRKLQIALKTMQQRPWSLCLTLLASFSPSHCFSTPCTQSSMRREALESRWF